MTSLPERAPKRATESFAELKSRIRRNGSSYSIVTTLFSFMFAVSLFLHLFASGHTRTELNLTGLGMFISIVLAAYCLVKGRLLPRWIGLAITGAQAAVTAVLLGFSTDTLSVSANFQTLPLMAIYLAWFYRKSIARTAIFISLAMIITLGVLGPGSYLDTNQALHEVIRLVLFMVLSVEIGILWKRRASSDSNTDDLTGASTRNELIRDTQRELRRNERYGTPMTVALIDLDDFKSVNDQHGHHAGDVVLTKVVDQLIDGTRCTDMVYRYGGDEFVLLLTNTREADARTLLSRLREGAPHAWSWGVAQAAVGDTTETLLNRADKEMFAHKVAGKTSESALG